MKIKKISFSTAEMNGGTIVKKEAFTDEAATGVGVSVTNVEVIRKYPIGMSLVNTTGVSIEVALIANENEEADFDANPANYFFMVPNNGSIGVGTKVGRAYKVAVRKESSNTTSSLRIDFMLPQGTVRTQKIVL